MQSVRSRITNISEHLSEPVSVEDFIRAIESHVQRMFPQAVLRPFTAEEEAAVNGLVERKYGTYEWNYGSSPAYGYRRGLHTEKGGNIEVHCRVADGRIAELKVFGDYFFTKDTAAFETAMAGCLLTEAALRERLATLPLQDYFAHVSVEEWLRLLMA